MSGSADFLAGLGAAPESSKKKKAVTPDKNKKTAYDLLDDSSLATPIAVFLRRYMRELTIASGVSALVGTVIVNAVFLQTGKHPAPLFVEHETIEISRQATAAIPKPREIILTKGDRPSAVNPIVVEMQRHLSARGYYNSEIDGLMGARTRAAIGLYQRAFGIAVTNEASRGLLEHIRLSIPDRDYHAKARQRVADATSKAEKLAVTPATAEPSDIIINDPERIKQVQQALSRLGFNLVADGVAGSNTNLAITEFKKQQGLVPDERITLALFNELIKLKKL